MNCLEHGKNERVNVLCEGPIILTYDVLDKVASDIMVLLLQMLFFFVHFHFPLPL